MTSQNDQETPRQDWNQLAKEALDIWQAHLSALSADSKAKEEVSKFIAPMTQMYAQWVNLMQDSFQGMMNPQTKPESAEAEESFPFSSSSSDPVTPQETSESDHVSATAPDVATPVVAVEPAPVITPVCEVVEPVVEPVIEPVVAVVSQPAPPTPEPAPVAVASEPPAGGRPAASDSSRDLAELASRLAELERELETLRPRAKRSGGDQAVAAALSRSGDWADNADASDATGAGDVQRMAGTRQG